MNQLDLATVAAGPAIFSTDRIYRYVLERHWDESKPTAAWIGLNPSTADEARLDPTLSRVARFSHSWGYGSFVMLNCFALRATDPLVMKRHAAPIGPENDDYILREAVSADIVIACWGVHAAHRQRSTEVRRMLGSAGIKLHYLKLTQKGEPWHPLYLSSTLTPQPFHA